jgi:hypothetical protein
MESKKVFQKVFKGVDSLYISYRGLLREGVKEYLEEKKELAQSDDETDQAISRVVICDHLFEVMGCGVRYYPIIMVDNWYRIQVSVSKAKKMPEIYVKISSEVLNCHGIDSPVVMLRKVVRKLLVKIEEEIVSRADLFVDFTTDVEFEKIDNASWVAKAKKLAIYWHGNSLTGMSIGLGGDISARIYDKTLEIGISNKDYIKKIWEKQGWDTLQKVWRLEFQLKRKYLKEMFIGTHLDLKIKANTLWNYCTSKWLRLVVTDDTVNRARLVTNPMWKKIQDVRINEGKLTSILREVDKSRVPSDEILFKNGMGYLTSFAAKEGFDNVNCETVISFLDIGKKYLEEVTNGKEEEYLKKKINNKKKKYNKE